MLLSSYSPYSFSPVDYLFALFSLPLFLAPLLFLSLSSFRNCSSLEDSLFYLPDFLKQFSHFYTAFIVVLVFILE
jgi:hypothetical protein